MRIQNSEFVVRRGRLYCRRCCTETMHERMAITHPDGKINYIYRCEECDLLHTKFGELKDEN